MLRNRFKKLLIAIILLFILFAGFFPTIDGSNIKNDSGILNKIEKICNKKLVINRIIDDINVKYWEHNINGFFVKNDYILLHQKIENSDIIKYEIQWRDVESLIPDNIKKDFQPFDFCWKELVIFPYEQDQTYFYEVNSDIDFPLICWEVRHNDGSTVLYDLEGNIIGNGIPTPFDGFSMSGFHETSWPDPWIDFRTNADSWYSIWCDTSTSISLPSPAIISSYVSDPDNMLFYELAHGAETYFQANTYGSYYTSSMTADDMVNRDPMRFAFIGSCHGMTSTGPGTFSYEFRKGQTTGTVTIGYDHMEECPGWDVALPWQDYMFYAMDSGFTIEESFNMANTEYPTISDCVVFVGDPNLKIIEEDDDDDEDDIIRPRVLITYPNREDEVKGIVNIAGTASHISGHIEKVYVQITGHDWELAKGTDNWEFTWDTTQEMDGRYVITAVSFDGHHYSGCHSIGVYVKNNDDEPDEKIPDLECEGSLGWTDVKPGSTQTGSFTVENIGDSESELNWEIIEKPEWGSWVINPEEGASLTPEMGKVTVEVSVVAPNEQEKTFAGQIKIVNKDDINDFEVIEFNLVTPKTKIIKPFIFRLLGNYQQILQLFNLFFI